MSRKVTAILATLAVVAGAVFASSAANANGYSGRSLGLGRLGGGGGGIGRPIGVVGRPGGGIGHPIGGIRVGGGVGHGPILLPPGRHGPSLPPPWWLHHHHHWHWWFHDGRWVVIEEPLVGGVAEPAPVPGPCTCLTKSYTQDGLVVFADLCTKESASAPIAGGAADATPVPSTPAAPSADDKASDASPPSPSNYAGRSYSDYLAANGQAAAQTAQKN